MIHVLWVFTVATLLSAANSYILLTANIKDIHALARQVVNSPVVGQLHTMYRRAATMFKQHLDRNGKNWKNSNENRNHLFRSDSKQNENSQDKSGENRDDAALIAIGRNASNYFDSIKKIIENI